MELQKSQTQKNLNILLHQLEAQEKEFNLKQSLAVAMERTDCEIKNINNLILDISEEFKSKKLVDIKEAIRQGAFGKFGITYKISTQVVGYWINQYLKEKYKTNQDRL